MSEIHPNPGRNLERVENEVVRPAAERAVRAFMERMTEDLRRRGTLTAAAELPEMARLLAWWGDAVDEHVASAVREAWLTGYRSTTDRAVIARSMDAVGEYVANATDRLSRTATPLLPDQAWAQLQTAIAQEMSIGSTRTTVARRIAAEMRWDVDTVYWERRKAEIARQLDAILDPLGPPGHPRREAALMNDARVQALQDANRTATQRMRAERSVWETRANRIARTETTGAYNAGTFDGALRSGAENKRWVATFDIDTRDTHMEAHGQTVTVDEDFIVGAAHLQFPGDPGAPAREAVNCRCTLTFPIDPTVDTLPFPEDLAGGV